MEIYSTAINNPYKPVFKGENASISFENKKNEEGKAASSYNTTYAQANNALKAKTLASPVIGYKKLKTFDVPFLDKGHIYKLNNDQKVIIVPKQGPTTIKTFVKVGSFNEKDDIRGISHFIEHSVFNGSKNLEPGEFVKNINEMGGMYNAGTGFSSTSYFIASPLHKSEDFDRFMKMHADMIQNPTFTPKMIEKEKGPVISEIHMYEDDPYDKAYNLSLKNLFNLKNNYQGLIAGSEANISNLDRNKVLDYYSNWYSPENMLTVVVGDVNPDNAIKTISKYFGSKPSQNNNNPAAKNNNHYEYLDNPITQTKRQDILTPNINSVLLNMTFIGPKNNDNKDSIAVSALNEALTGHETSKLIQALKPLNTKATAELNVISPKYNDPQVLQLNVNFKPGEEEKGIETVFNAIQEFAQTPLSDDELAITKNKLKENYTNASEYSMDVTEMIGESVIDHGNLNYYTDKIKVIESLTAQDIQSAAQKYLDLNKTSMVVVHPNEESKNANSAKFAGKIKFGSNQNKSPLGEIKEYYLSNNIQVAINNNQNSAKTTAIFNFKTDNFPDAKPGVAPVLAIMLEKGSKTLSENQMNKIIDGNNLGIKPETSNDAISIIADCQPEKLPMALDMMKEIIYNPDFSEEKFEKAKKETKFFFASMPESPLSRAEETLYEGTPYGYSARKIAENIDNVTLNDVKKFYNDIMQNAQGKVILTAPVNKNPEMQNVLFNSLSNLPNVQKPHYVNNFEYTPLKKNTVITKAEDRHQAHIIQMFKIKENGNIKDQAALNVLNEILGGNSHSRLFEDLREKKNLGYKVHSYYTSDGKASEILLEIKTTTKDSKTNKPNDYIKKSIDGFQQHINNLINSPVTQEELEGAKLSVKSKMIFNSESSFGQSNLILNGYNSPYGSQYTAELLKAIDNLTPKDINNAAKLYLNAPSVTSLIAHKDAIADAKEYLQSKGELQMY